MASDEARCPVCASDEQRTIHDGIKLCVRCRIAFNTGFEPKNYGDTYFLEEYRRQYSVTYMEDFPGIYRLSKRRLEVILHLLGKKRDISSLTLLDIGSAAGFFLRCALDHGIGSVNGIEISQYACRLSKKMCGIPVINSSFENASIDCQYDIITAWYFIEHCNDPVSVMKRIHVALRDNGLFAFSMPSIFGPLFLFRRNEWIATHPGDHRIDISPRGIRKMLDKCGFRTVFMRAAGVHPERVISPFSPIYRPFAYLYKLFARMTSFSDTIEVFAIKR